MKMTNSMVIYSKQKENHKMAPDSNTLTHSGASSFSQRGLAKVYDLSGKVVEEVKLPEVFSTAYKPVVIQRAVLAAQSAKRQPYGINPLAGKRTSAHYHGKRKYRYTMMNKEMARIARIHGKVGSMSMRARFVPQAVKGRRAHGPKAERVWLQKINNKELQLAIRSALAAASNKELVAAHGHRFERELPVIIIDDFENIKKTKDMKNVLEAVIGSAEMDRAAERKIRAGKGKMRGRKYRKRKGPLLIFSKQCESVKASQNIPGVDVAVADNLNIESLAPGAKAGRLIVLTKSALQKLS